MDLPRPHRLLSGSCATLLKQRPLRMTLVFGEICVQVVGLYFIAVYCIRLERLRENKKSTQMWMEAINIILSNS